MHRWSASDRIELGRRHVAIMFADFAGFAGLIESIGAERAVGRLSPVMDKLVALVLAHDGSVQRIVEGSSMSVFGLRATDGHEEAQAVRAGAAVLSAAAEHGILPVHIGIECGEVVVSRSWEPAGFAVWGDSVTAARELCDAADPGTMLLGPGARGLAHDAGTRPLGAGMTGAARSELGERGLGHRGQTGDRPATNALTRAEMAVARLVAEGLSNPQIADRLYISRHTAETHMKHIFAKLGISSRAELAARVARQLVRGVA